MTRRTFAALAAAASLLLVVGADASLAHVDLTLGDAVAGSTTTLTTATTEDRPGTTLEAQARDDEGSPAPWLIGSGIAAALAVGVGGRLLKRRADG